jgi:hypothetical protein
MMPPLKGSSHVILIISSVVVVRSLDSTGASGTKALRIWIVSE